MQKETNQHPVLSHKKTSSQKYADFLTSFLGSWKFITFFVLFILIWISLNAYLLTKMPWDPYPFILLNLTLSCVAAIQAPIILMSQNRQTQVDRIRVEYDYSVNKKAEKEIEQIKKQLNRIEGKLK